MALARWSGGICSMRSICLGCSFIWFSLTCSHPTFEPTAKTRTQAMMALTRKAIHQAVPRRMSVKVFAGSKKVLAMRSGCESSGFSATTVVGIVPMGVSPIVSLSAAGLYREAACKSELWLRLLADRESLPLGVVTVSLPQEAGMEYFCRWVALRNTTAVLPTRVVGVHVRQESCKFVDCPRFVHAVDRTTTRAEWQGHAVLLLPR